MFGGSYSPSVADIAAVTNPNGNCQNGYGWGNEWHQPEHLYGW